MKELINILSEQIILNIHQGGGYDADRQYLRSELSKFCQAIEEDTKAKHSLSPATVSNSDNGISLERVFQIQRDSRSSAFRELEDRLNPEDSDPEG